MQTPQELLGKPLGVLEVAVGAGFQQRVISLPISTLSFSRMGSDSVRTVGGFFDDGDGHVGIIVDADASPGEVKEQIRAAVKDAVAHFDKRTLN